MSLELLGAELAPRGILVRVRNAPELAAKQGGIAGAVAAQLVPDTIESVVLDKMAEQLRASLREKGVDAEVRILSGTGQEQAEAGAGFGTGLVAGAVLTGALWVALLGAKGLKGVLSRFS